MTEIDLQYGTAARSCASTRSKAKADFAPGRDIRANWAWEMKKTGSLPPGTQVWWQWKVTNEAGGEYVSPKQTVVFEDPRFVWSLKTIGSIDIYWHEGGGAFGDELARGVDANLSRLKLEAETSQERQIKAFIYASSSELQTAVLFTQEWTGGVAFSDYNIVLIGISPPELDWGKRALTHELAHLLVGEVTFNCLGDIPSWLSEGLAQYSEGAMTEYYQEVLRDAIVKNELMSVRSLGASFPADPEQASLAYAQSHTLVSYVVHTHGWAKMRQLLAVFSEGSTYDDALKKVYGFNSDGLEDLWRAHVGAPKRSTS